VDLKASCQIANGREPRSRDELSAAHGIADLFGDLLVEGHGPAAVGATSTRASLLAICALRGFDGEVHETDPSEARDPVNRGLSGRFEGGFPKI
jgi:hypothetical protein